MLILIYSLFAIIEGFTKNSIFCRIVLKVIDNSIELTNGQAELSNKQFRTSRDQLSNSQFQFSINPFSNVQVQIPNDPFRLTLAQIRNAPPPAPEKALICLF